MASSFSMGGQLSPQISGNSGPRQESWSFVDSQATSNFALRSPASFNTASFEIRDLMRIPEALENGRSITVARSAELLDQLHVEYVNGIATLGDNRDTEGAGYSAAFWFLDELSDVLQGVSKELQDSLARSHAALSKSWSSRIQSVIDQKRFDSSVVSTVSQASSAPKALDELNIYLLLSKILRVRSSNQERGIDESIQLYLGTKTLAHDFTPEPEIWEHYLLQDPVARERKAVLEWLEDCAKVSESDFESIIEELQTQAGTSKGTWSHGFLHTREIIKAEKRRRLVDTYLDSPTLRTKENTEPLVTQLDPDAQTRQDRSLEPQDNYYDRALWLACFAMLRRGMKWDEIRSWCENHKEGWRAISFGMAVKAQESSTGLGGPQAGLLWRQMCLAAARHTGYDAYQRAVYGLLAGDIKNVEPACRSFDDLLFVRYNALLIRQFEDYLNVTSSRKYSDILGQKFPVLNSTLTDDERTLPPAEYVYRILGNPVCASQDAENPLKVIQAAIIGDDFERMIAHTGIILSHRANQGENRSYIFDPMESYNYDARYECLADDIDAIRILVHILAVYETLGVQFDEQIRKDYIQNVVVAYIDFLRIQGYIVAIPSYAAMLDTDRKERTIAIVLAELSDPSEQQQMLNLILPQNVDVPRLIMQQYQYAAAIMGFTEDQYDSVPQIDILMETDDARWPGYRLKRNTEMEKALTPDQERLVRSVEYFRYEDDQSRWKDTFGGLSFVLRSLLQAGMTNAALSLCKRVPYKAVSLLKTKVVLGTAIDVFDSIEPELSSQNGSKIRRSTRSTFKQQESFEMDEEQEFMIELLRDQAQQFREMQQMVLALECLNLWRALERDAMRDGPTAKVKIDIAEELEAVTELVKPLLVGFMTKFNSPDQVIGYSQIRQAYLPKIILGYNSARTFAANFLGAETILPSLELATILASDENNELQQDFESQGLMGFFIKAMAGTSKVLIRLNQERELANREEGKKRRHRKEKKSRFWTGENVELWDPTKVV